MLESGLVVHIVISLKRRKKIVFFKIFLFFLSAMKASEENN